MYFDLIDTISEDNYYDLNDKKFGGITIDEFNETYEIFLKKIKSIIEIIKNAKTIKDDPKQKILNDIRIQIIKITYSYNKIIKTRLPTIDFEEIKNFLQKINTTYNDLISTLLKIKENYRLNIDPKILEPMSLPPLQESQTVQTQPQASQTQSQASQTQPQASKTPKQKPLRGPPPLKKAQPKQPVQPQQTLNGTDTDHRDKLEQLKLKVNDKIYAYGDIHGDILNFLYIFNNYLKDCDNLLYVNNKNKQIVLLYKINLNDSNNINLLENENFESNFDVIDNKTYFAIKYNNISINKEDNHFYFSIINDIDMTNVNQKNYSTKISQIKNYTLNNIINETNYLYCIKINDSPYLIINHYIYLYSILYNLYTTYLYKESIDNDKDSYLTIIKNVTIPNLNNYIKIDFMYDFNNQLKNIFLNICNNDNIRYYLILLGDIYDVIRSNFIFKYKENDDQSELYKKKLKTSIDTDSTSNTLYDYILCDLLVYDKSINSKKKDNYIQNIRHSLYNKFICNNLTFTLLKQILLCQKYRAECDKPTIFIHNNTDDKFNWRFICINGNHECVTKINCHHPEPFCNYQSLLYYTLFENELFTLDIENNYKYDLIHDAYPNLLDVKNIYGVQTYKYKSEDKKIVKCYQTNPLSNTEIYELLYFIYIKSYFFPNITFVKRIRDKNIYFHYTHFLSNIEMKKSVSYIYNRNQCKEHCKTNAEYKLSYDIVPQYILRSYQNYYEVIQEPTMSICDSSWKSYDHGVILDDCNITYNDTKKQCTCYQSYYLNEILRPGGINGYTRLTDVNNIFYIIQGHQYDANLLKNHGNNMYFINLDTKSSIFESTTSERVIGVCELLIENENKYVSKISSINTKDKSIVGKFVLENNNGELITQEI